MRSARAEADEKVRSPNTPWTTASHRRRGGHRCGNRDRARVRRSAAVSPRFEDASSAPPTSISCSAWARMRLESRRDDRRLRRIFRRSDSEKRADLPKAERRLVAGTKHFGACETDWHLSPRSPLPACRHESGQQGRRKGVKGCKDGPQKDASR